MTRRDVLVVGGGPAGLTAATQLAKSGTEVVLFEREQEPGGIPRHCHNPSFGLRETMTPQTGPAFARRLVDRAVRAGVVIETDATVTDLNPGDSPGLTTTSTRGRESWTAGAVILATGARERPRHARRISGSRAKGVYTTGELQQQTHLFGERVGDRAIVYGAEHVSFSALMTLRKAGIEPVAIVTSQPSHQSYEAFRLFATRLGRVPIYTNYTIASIEGRDRVSGVWLYYPGWGAWPGSDAQVIDARSIETRHRRQSFVECDTVIVSGDWVAEGDLAVRSRLESDISIGGRPDVGPDGGTSRPGLFATGALTRPGESAGSATSNGRKVAKAVERHLSGVPNPASVQLVPFGFRWIWPNWVHPAQPSDLRFRVDVWMQRPTVVIRQDGRVIETISFRRTEPGRTYSLNADWMRRIVSDTPVEVEIVVE
jgi:thioredoxin reductase